MTNRPTHRDSRPAAFALGAVLVALLVALCGIYPHVRWMLEIKQLTWFYNSYDEGYYGWLSMRELSFQRGLSDLVMHALYWVAGANAQRAMILTDFFLPMGAALAACYLVRPLFAHPAGMAAGALFILVSAECWALRSTFIPHAGLHDFLTAKNALLPSTSANFVQLGNQTSTFWLFRTPEPQVSWIVMFLVLGFVLRSVMAGPGREPRPRSMAVWSMLAGASYLFCALSVSGILLLFAALTIWSHRRLALIIGAGGLVCFATCLGVSLAGQSGGESLVFASRSPVLMLSALLGLLAIGVVFQRKQGPLQPAQLLAIALGLMPLGLANQQLLTGRMIYLLNFENFGLAQVAALALLAAVFIRPSSPASAGTPVPGQYWRWAPTIGALLVCLLLGGVLVRSQVLSYAGYLSDNRVGLAYARAVGALPDQGAAIACDDFFQTDTLALRLGYRPEFLIARDAVFTRPIARLGHPLDVPAGSAEPRQALYRYLALTGLSPAGLSQRLTVLTEPNAPNWQDLFMLGAFLYNHADFWAPLTHGRDLRVDWIRGQQAMIVKDYTDFLGRENPVTRPVLYFMRADRPTPSFMSEDHHARAVALPSLQLPVAIKVYRVDSPAAGVAH